MARSTRKAILLDDVEHLGDRGEVVSVSRGYLRNYLVPRKLAEEATPARIAEVERLAATRAAQEARTLEQANEIATLLTKTVLTIPARSGPDGRLYGSVTAADLADEIWRARKVRVDRRKIRLEEPIKAIGSYLVEIDVFPEVRAAVKTQVVQVEGFEFDGAEVESEEAVAEAIVDEVVEEIADDVAVEQAD
jgi:large subunit ribosomal protein L9